ncbi:MAG: T9SS type A sorting domain-containing protein [Flavobacteriales bacterium]
MNKFHTLLTAILSSFTAHGQCGDVAILVSASDTSYVQLYHPAFFLIPSGFANVCTWEVATFDGAVVHEAITFGEWADQSFTLFDHTVPITDSMLVTLVITNDSSGITCTITDTLYWEETEVLPGSFIGNWAILNSSGGVQTGSADRAGTDKVGFAVLPGPALDHVRITGLGGSCSLAIHDANGALVATHANVGNNERVDVSWLPSGVYLIRLWDARELPLGTRRFVKL